MSFARRDTISIHENSQRLNARRADALALCRSQNLERSRSVKSGVAKSGVGVDFRRRVVRAGTALVEKPTPTPLFATPFLAVRTLGPDAT
jgi:hypothetical protein